MTVETLVLGVGPALIHMLMSHITPQVEKYSNEKPQKCTCMSNVLAFFPILRGLAEV